MEAVLRSLLICRFRRRIVRGWLTEWDARCSTLALMALGLTSGTNPDAVNTVSQTLNILYHAPAVEYVPSFFSPRCAGEYVKY